MKESSISLFSTLQRFNQTKIASDFLLPIHHSEFFSSLNRLKIFDSVSRSDYGREKEKWERLWCWMNGERRRRVKMRKNYCKFQEKLLFLFSQFDSEYVKSWNMFNKSLNLVESGFWKAKVKRDQTLSSLCLSKTLLKKQL